MPGQWDQSGAGDWRVEGGEAGKQVHPISTTVCFKRRDEGTPRAHAHHITSHHITSHRITQLPNLDVVKGLLKPRVFHRGTDAADKAEAKLGQGGEETLGGRERQKGVEAVVGGQARHHETHVVELLQVGNPVGTPIRWKRAGFCGVSWCVVVCVCVSWCVCVCVCSLGDGNSTTHSLTHTHTHTHSCNKGKHHVAPRDALGEN